MTERQEILNRIKEEVTICIPTYKREKQITYESLCDELKEITYLVVSSEDKLKIEKRYPKAKFLLSYSQEQGLGLGKTREWIMDTVDSKYIIMFDDNMMFYKRVSDNDWHLKYADNLDIFDGNQTLQMVDYMVQLAKKENYFGIGLSSRQGNNNVTGDYTENSRMFASFLLNREIFMKESIKFGDIKIMEDFGAFLKLLTRGYKNAVVYKYCFGKPSASMPGGCSAYRNFDTQKEACYILKDLFPEFVSIVKKKTKNWGDELNFRYDVRISWKKAYDSHFLPKRRNLF